MKTESKIVRAGAPGWRLALWSGASAVGLFAIWITLGSITVLQSAPAREFVTTGSILLVVAATALLSGMMGMVGGMILIGSLVLMLDLGTAMLLATAVLVSTNLWRMLTWLRDVRWDIAAFNLVGGLLASVHRRELSGLELANLHGRLRVLHRAGVLVAAVMP